MKNELLDLLYKLQSEESLSEENRQMLEQAIQQLESEDFNSNLKEMAILTLRLFLQYFDPDKWDFFNN